MKKAIQFGMLLYNMMLYLNLLLSPLNVLSQVETSTDSLIDIDEYKQDSAYFFLISMNIDYSTFFEVYKNDLGLTDKDDLILRSSKKDDLGITHDRYKQYYEGIEVEDGDYILHSIDGNVIIANGNLAKGLEIDINPAITEEQAIEIALLNINAELYTWQGLKYDSILQDETGNPNATYYPVPTLKIVSKNNESTNETEFRLCYYFIVSCIEPEAVYSVKIDAKNGDVIERQSLTNFCSGHTGTCTTMYNGSRSFTDKWQLFWFNYRLEDCTRGDGIRTKIDESATLLGGWGLSDDVTDNDGNWGASNQTATTVHWEIQKAFDYFEAIHSEVGTGHPIRIWADWREGLDGDPVANAFFSNDYFGYDYIAFGTDAGGYLGTLDIAGHEYTHGIIYNNANFDFAGEPASLAESYADIFGQAIERYITGSTDWLAGADAGADRSLSDPPSINQIALSDRPSIGQPDIYHGTLWYYGTDDASGAHINNGVQNKWFYLLAQGGTFNGVTVTAIGFDKAIKIAFRAVSVYLVSNSNYTDSRNWTIQAAKDLYGKCSSEAYQTIRAWAAVGVGNIENLLCVTINGPTSVCQEELNDIDYVFNATTVYNGTTNPTGITFSWSNAPSWSGWTYTIGGIGNKTLTVTNITSSATKTLTATSTFGGVTNSDTHTITFPDCDPDGCPPLCRIGDIETSTNLNINVFPNPATGYVKYDFGYLELPCTLTLYNTSGVKFKEYLIFDSFGHVDISELPTGLYILRIKDAVSNATIKLSVVN